MRVIYVVPGLGISGGINVILEHAHFLAEHHHEVLIVTMGEDCEVRWRMNRCPVWPLSESVSIDTILAKPIDILVLTGWQTVYALQHSRLPARNYVYFVQSDEARFFQANSDEALLATATYQLGCHYLTEARWIRDWLRSLGHDPLYAPNGVDHKLFQPQQPLVPKGDKLRVLIEGPLAIDFKRVREAFAAVQGLDLEVWCVSSAGSLQPWMRPDMFFDTVPIARMPSIYSSCDVLLKLSSVEGFFGPPLEMMACGGTAITSDVSGHDEFMCHGENGLVVPGGDPRLVREWLARLILDRTMLARLQTNALSTAAEFRWDTSLATVQTWMLALSQSITHGSFSGLFPSPPQYATFELCARQYGSIFPPRKEAAIVQDLNVKTIRTRNFYARIEGWSWPSPAAMFHCEDGRVLDCSIRFVARPDVVASGRCPAGGFAGFAAEVLLDVEGNAERLDPSRLTVELKDGTRIGLGHACDGQGYVDFIDSWSCFRMSFECRETFDPSFVFRIVLEGRRSDILLFDGTAPPALAAGAHLRSSESSAGKANNVIVTDQLLLYSLAEDPKASCLLFVPERSLLTNIFAIREVS